MRSPYIESSRVARALQLSSDQLAGLLGQLPAGSHMRDDRGRTMVQASAIEAAVCGSDPPLVATFYRLVDLTPSPATGPTDAQKAAAFQARHTVETFRAGRATIPAPAGREAEFAAARSAARAVRGK